MALSQQWTGGRRVERHAFAKDRFRRTQPFDRLTRMTPIGLYAVIHIRRKNKIDIATNLTAIPFLALG